LDGFSQLSVGFSSEAGVVKHFLPSSLSHWRGCPSVDGQVRCFLLTFCVKTKSKSGFGAEAPIKQNSFLLMYYGVYKYWERNDVLSSYQDKWKNRTRINADLADKKTDFNFDKSK